MPDAPSQGHGLPQDPAPVSLAPFRRHLREWRLVPDGYAVATPSSLLLPVRHQGLPAMLKLATVDEERQGAELLDWWDGDGAARVLRGDDAAVLLERALGPGSLAEMARAGQDDDASRIVCGVAARLHVSRHKPLPRLRPLDDWFRELWPAAELRGGIFQQAAVAARELLAEVREPVALHGDLHHGNVLDFAERGWLAIDPKGLLGERGFDYANIFCNPDFETATRPGRFEQQLEVVAAAAKLDRERLLNWVLAYAGLSAAWSLSETTASDGSGVLEARTALAIAELAAAQLR